MPSDVFAEYGGALVTAPPDAKTDIFAEYGGKSVSTPKPNLAAASAEAERAAVTHMGPIAPPGGDKRPANGQANTMQMPCRCPPLPALNETVPPLFPPEQAIARLVRRPRRPQRGAASAVGGGGTPSSQPMGWMVISISGLQ